MSRVKKTALFFADGRAKLGAQQQAGMAESRCVRALCVHGHGVHFRVMEQGQLARPR